MPIPTPAAYGMYSQDAALGDVVRTLNQAGFDNESICMVLSPRHPIAKVVREASILNGGRDRGALTAGLIGWLSEFGAVVIPSVGFFIRSKTFLRALFEPKGSPAFCGNTNTLVGLGFSETEARYFDRQVRQFGALVYVSCPENARTDRAMELLGRTGATQTAILSAEMKAAAAVV
jgi:hypothetical protein